MGREPTLEMPQARRKKGGMPAGFPILLPAINLSEKIPPRLAPRGDLLGYGYSAGASGV